MHAGIYKSTESTICMIKRDKPLHYLAKHAAPETISYGTLFLFVKKYLYYFGKICFMKKHFNPLSFLRMTYVNIYTTYHNCGSPR